ncbi:ATP-binding cassette subfamily C protein CydC [Labrenzia sp. EL_195]|nr:ATP-binding cassette subfamily C protein CydC [Labrenzia sp. EL_195]
MTAVWQFIKSQQRFSRLHFWVGIAVSLLPVAAGILLLGVSGWFITAAALAGLSGAFLNIFAPSAIIRALAIIRTAGRYGERVLTHDATFRFLTDLRNRLFEAYAIEPAKKKRSGTVLNRLTADIDALDSVYLRLVVPIVLAVIVATFLLVVWATVSRAVFTVGLIFIAAWAILAWRSFDNSERNTVRRADAASDAMRLRVADLAGGRRDIAVYGGLGDAADHILTADGRLMEVEEKLEQRSNRLVGLSSLIGQTFLAFMLLVCAWEVADGRLTLAPAVGLVLVVMALPELFSAMLPGLANLPRTELAAERSIAARRKNAGTEGSTAKPEAPSELEDTTDAVLRFESVRFNYPGAARPILDGLSLEIGHGEVVAVAGRSGCGKTTVASLAARLLDADQGTIWLNGTDIRDFSESDLRRSVAVLSQRPYLFNDTIAANLRIANPDAGEAELWEALERSALAERIAQDGDGLQSILGEAGLGLSGGEQRRLALARAFLTRPSLYVLDEMTEGLDENTGAEVLARFLDFRTDQAVLMIAHKDRELDVADRVVRLSGKDTRLP